MKYKLFLTLKYRINELRPNDMDDLELVSDKREKLLYELFELLEIRPWESTSEDLNGFRFCDLTYIVNDDMRLAMNLLFGEGAIQMEPFED